MKSFIKKMLFFLILAFGAAIMVSIGIVAYEIYVSRGRCGMNDGPYEAGIIDLPPPSEEVKKFHLKGDALLVLDNRTDSISPVISLLHEGRKKWSLEMDTRYTNPVSLARIWKLEDVSIKENRRSIELEFIAHWTFGREKGWMEIERDNGDNYFCLGW